MKYLALFGLLACSAGSDSDDTDIDTDADADSDADSDADTDTDADTDSDADTDTGPDGDEVTVAYTGTIATVSGTPFGFDSSIRTAAVHGTFTFDPDVPDDDADDPMRSTWTHLGNGGFTFEIDGQTLLVSGSGAPIVSEELYSYTWRFEDGPDASDDTTDRTMDLNGVADPDVDMGLSITGGSDTPWLTDAALQAWPAMDPHDYAITFSVEDENGLFLMSLDTCAEVAE